MIRARLHPAALLAVLGVIAFAAMAAPPFSLKREMSAEDFERCGLQKLTPQELDALSEWMSGRLAQAPRSPSATPAVAGQGVRSVATEMVALNTQSGKYHCLTCSAARACTTNCIEVPLPQAQQRGVSCKICGGTCR